MTLRKNGNGSKPNSDGISIDGFRSEVVAGRIEWNRHALERMVERNIGGLYNPDTNSWSTITTTNAPSVRWNFPGVWTGSKMIVFGGRTGGAGGITMNTGGIYVP